MKKEIRKQNLEQLRKEYSESFKQALASQNLTPEDFSRISLIPIEIIENYLSGKLRYLGDFNYAASCLNKRIKIEFAD